MMDPIIINKDEVLILKTEMLLHPRDVEKVRNDVIRQIEGGAVIIPNGFTYTICKRDCFEHEKELIFECCNTCRYIYTAYGVDFCKVRETPMKNQHNEKCSAYKRILLSTMQEGE